MRGFCLKWGGGGGDSVRGWRCESVRGWRCESVRRIQCEGGRDKCGCEGMREVRM